jgi:hypothetical protein
MTAAHRVMLLAGGLQHYAERQIRNMLSSVERRKATATRVCIEARETLSALCLQYQGELV